MKIQVDKLRLSYSGAQTFLSCRQKWYWNYQENLKRKESSYPLQVGSIVHDLLHRYYTGDDIMALLEEDHQGQTGLQRLIQEEYPENNSQETILVAHEAFNLVGGYLSKYLEDPLQVISSEMKILHDRIEPETQQEYQIYAIVDAVCRTQDQRLWRLEHKTASRVDTYYLNGLRGGLQGGIYHYLLNEVMPEPIVGTIYNMLVKTKIPHYERMPVMMQKQLAQRSLETFDGVARQIYQGDIFKDAGSCFSFNRECDYMPLCNLWKGQWDEPTLRIKNSFFQPYKVETNGKEAAKNKQAAED